MDYYETKRDELDPNMMTVTVANHDPPLKLRVAKTSQASVVLRDVRKSIPECKSLWTVTDDGVPIECIPAKFKIKDALAESGRCFWSPLSTDHLQKPCMFDIKVFFREAEDPMQDFGFHAFEISASVDSLFPLVSRLAGYPPATKYDCFVEFGKRVKKAEKWDSALIT